MKGKKTGRPTNEFRKFDEMLRRVVNVPKEEINRREEEEKRKKAAKKKGG